MKTTAILTLCVLAAAFALSVPSLRLASRDDPARPPAAPPEERVSIDPEALRPADEAAGLAASAVETARKDVERQLLVPLREREAREIRASAFSRIARPQPQRMDYAVDFEAAGPEGIGGTEDWLPFTVRAAPRTTLTPAVAGTGNLPVAWSPVADGRWHRSDGAVHLYHVGMGKWLPAAAHPLLSGF